MTIRLLARHDKYTANTIVTLDAATEAGLIAAKQATADLTGGVPYVAPPAAPNQLYPLQVAVDASGNSVGVVGFNGQSVSLGGGGPGSVSVAGIGDSLTFGNTNSTSPAAAANFRSIGFLVWMMQLSEGAVYFDGSLNYGIGGQTSAQVYARSAANAADMKARGARFCTVLVGTNDLNDPAVTEKQVVDNTAGICANLMAQGVTPIVIPILPRAYDGGPLGTAITPERQRTLQRWANGQRNYAKRTPGVMLFDPTTMLTDHSDALGYPVGRLTASSLAFTSDGLHITARSAFLLGRGLFNLVKPFLPAYCPPIPSRADVYDPVYNPAGNRAPAPFMVGTGGAILTGAAGVTADNTFLTRQGAGTGTITGSKGTSTVEGATIPTQICTITGATGAAEAFRFYESLSGLTIGQKVNAAMAINVSGVTAGSLASVTVFGVTGTVFSYGNRSETGQYQPDDSWSGVIPIPEFIATATTALLILEIKIDGTVANSGATVTVRRVGFNAVDPA